LKNVGDQVEYRKHESDHRLEYVHALKRSLLQGQTFLQTANDEKFAHITNEEKKKVQDEVTNGESWLQSELARQETIPINDNPTITCEFLRQKKIQVDSVVEVIINKPKPKPEPKPEPKKEEPKKEDGKGSGTASPPPNSAEKEKEKDKKAEEKPKTDDKNAKDKMDTQ